MKGQFWGGQKSIFWKNEYDHVKDLIFLRRYVLIQIENSPILALL